MDRILDERCLELERTLDRLKLLASQDALLILRSAFGSSKMLNVLRSSPCMDHPAIIRFDSLLRSGLTSITNCALDDSSWLQASLPIPRWGSGYSKRGRACPFCIPCIGCSHARAPGSHPESFTARNGWSLCVRSPYIMESSIPGHSTPRYFGNQAKKLG